MVLMDPDMHMVAGSLVRTARALGRNRTKAGKTTKLKKTSAERERRALQPKKRATRKAILILPHALPMCVAGQLSFRRLAPEDHVDH
ncbi:hypothetical protein [Deinococcus alpinitundrae]|uniref:hypothetical protein n=1 Tax=Deinococcus alpinitundrae TaxID=468913 RepID=UPI0013793DB6|nr:hypothetical protein [Deinococcus alpinitundrae]